jgi:pyrroline-5-carboxylate reductase
MITKRIAIIGVGNMGGAIARRLLDKNVVGASNLFLCNKTLADLDEYRGFGCLVTDEIAEAVKNADVILFAVKPQVFLALLPELKKFIKPGQLILTIAAGVPIDFLKQAFGQSQPVVRIMPNLCAMIGESMSVWVKSEEVTRGQEAVVKEILQAIGKEIMFSKEELIDAATAISGSGPAYLFYLTEILETNARDLGIPAGAATLLARQTVIGSARLLANSEKSAKELRLGVTSKGGTTEAAFVVFDAINLKAVFKNGVRAAWIRAKELRKE